jgi:WD40 repeat protein
VFDVCGLVQIYGVRSGRLLRSVQLPDRVTNIGIGWAPDSQKAYFAAAGGALIVLDLTTGAVQERPGSQDFATVVDVSPDGRFAAVGGSGGIVDVYDTRTLQLVRQHVLGGPIESLALTNDSLAVLDNHQIMHIWDTCPICENAQALAHQLQEESVRQLTPGERAEFVP